MGNGYSGIRRGFSSINADSIIGGGYFRGKAAVKEGSSIFGRSRGGTISSEE